MRAWIGREVVAGGAVNARALALATRAVAHAAQGEAVAVELEAPARPVLCELVDAGAMRRAIVLLERDGLHSRIAARPRRSGGASTITEVFEEDHRRLDELAAEMRRTAHEEPMRAVVLASLLASGLRRHVRIEEAVVFPVHAARSGYAATTARMRAEHAAILRYVERIEREADLLRVTSQRDRAATHLLDAEAGLAAVLAAHNVSEEQSLFPLVDHTTPADLRQQMIRTIVTF